MTTKSRIINAAYAQMRISGLTVDPTPEDLELALDRLEDMCAELEGRNLCLNYNFEDTPDPATQTGVDKKFNHMLKTNLAIRLIADFGQVTPPTLATQAVQSMSAASSMVAADNVREVSPSRRMPRGNGHRFNRFRRYQNAESLPPNDCDTNQIEVGEIQAYTEDFQTWLGTETISSFSIVADTGLTVTGGTNNDPIISYTVEAVDSNTKSVWQQVKITVTDSLGRKEIRIVDFEVIAVPSVGS